jgi:hypothetical protein
MRKITTAVDALIGTTTEFVLATLGQAWRF